MPFERAKWQMFDFTDTSNDGINASERSVLDELDQFASGADLQTGTDIDFGDGNAAAGAQGSAHGALRMPGGISASAATPSFGHTSFQTRHRRMSGVS